MQAPPHTHPQVRKTSMRSAPCELVSNVCQDWVFVWAQFRSETEKARYGNRRIGP